MFHSYPLSVRVTRWFSLFCYASILIYIFFVFSNDLVVFILKLVFAAVVLYIAAWFWNLQPEIIANKDGLSVHFLWWWLPVKWNDIVDVREHVLVKFFRKPFGFQRKGAFIVRAKSLTFFHRLYFFQTFTFMPSLIIYSYISGFDELISFIKKHIPEKVES